MTGFPESIKIKDSYQGQPLYRLYNEELNEFIKNYRLILNIIKEIIEALWIYHGKPNEKLRKWYSQVFGEQRLKDFFYSLNNKKIKADRDREKRIISYRKKLDHLNISEADKKKIIEYWDKSDINNKILKYDYWLSLFLHQLKNEQDSINKNYSILYNLIIKTIDKEFLEEPIKEFKGKQNMTNKLLRNIHPLIN